MKKKSPATPARRSARKPPSQLGLPGLEPAPIASPAATQLALAGLEPDCLLAFLALTGILRALECSRPKWGARISWSGPPWLATLHVNASVSQADVAIAAVEGIEAIASHYDVFGKSDVDFSPEEYRQHIGSSRKSAHRTPLLAALCAEAPLAKNGKKLLAAPLVMMFGQGHQHFLSRLIDVAGAAPLGKKKNGKDHAQSMHGPEKIEEALFAPWKRSDVSPAFRWDPEEDQRYALRFRSPSDEGAAPTVHGANRLACVGLLTFSAVPNESQQRTVGARRANGGGTVEFVWPIWGAPISLVTLEALLVHPDVMGGNLERVRGLGVSEIYSCRRIQNQKFLNVARARAASQAGQPTGTRSASG